MNREIKALALSVAFASSLCAEQSSKITVFVYNYAVVSVEVLARTEAEASRIYTHAGIEIEWLECPLTPKDADQFPACQLPPGPARLALRILSQSMAERLRRAGFRVRPVSLAHSYDLLINERARVALRVAFPRAANGPRRAHCGIVLPRQSPSLP